MSLIAERVKNRAKAKLEEVRTGQRITGYLADGTPVYDRPTNGGSGACFAAPTQTQSHGSACPTGDCPPDQLAGALGRTWADSGPCRELPYWLELTADAGGLIDIEFNSAVTMCPTRIEVVEETPLAGSRLESLEFGNTNQMVGDALFLVGFAPGSFQAIPWVPDCVRSGFPIRIQMTGVTPLARVWIAFVGPMSG